MVTVEALGGTPYFLFKANAPGPNDDRIWAKVCHLFMYNREAYMLHYHRCSNAGYAFSLMKGGSLATQLGARVR
jgi:hypothetical protein